MTHGDRATLYMGPATGFQALSQVGTGMSSFVCFGAGLFYTILMLHHLWNVFFYKDKI